MKHEAKLLILALLPFILVICATTIFLFSLFFLFFSLHRKLFAKGSCMVASWTTTLYTRFMLLDQVKTPSRSPHTISIILVLAPRCIIMRPPVKSTCTIPKNPFFIPLYWHGLQKKKYFFSSSGGARGILYY